jgi:peptidoglycan-associated lipoprotein
MRLALIAALFAAAGLLAAGCATTPDEQPPAQVESRPSTGKPPTQVDTRPVKPVDVTGKPGEVDPRVKQGILAQRSVYFDYDSFEVKSEYRPLVEAHAKYLRENPAAKMLIQGNADERGSREYNVGLGQRRSDSVKKMLTLLGAREAQIESVSLGEEKPSCSESNEGCWAKNRRGDMLYGGEF